MEKLKGSQRKHLRGLAHALKPVVMVGEKGLTESLVKNLDQALLDHELVKVKFLWPKEKEAKGEMTAQLEEAVSAEMVGMIGHMATFFRPHPDPEKRKIAVPGYSPTRPDEK
ncbi:MAG: ribosome assembly RNA-binding protein YhbY [Proteobacteria bacterium]|nr:ribosome assembly RNA-binding protein YhbY [Pseudomonadota bacterium]